VGKAAAGRGVVLVLCAVIAVLFGTPGAASAVVLPPGTPTNLVATADDGAVYLAWSAPTNDGGAPITGYRVTDSAGQTVVAPCGMCTSVYFSGLTDGIQYSFMVVADNAAGYASTVPAVSRVVTPVALSEPQDSQPENVSAAVDGQSATVTWQPPSNTNGLPIDRYLITISDVSLTNKAGAVYYAGWQYACGTCTSATINGLTAGDTYEFEVNAHNQGAQGIYGVYGLAAMSNRVVPTNSSCTPGTVCLSVDGNSDQGPIAWRADGFLHGLQFTQGFQGGALTYAYRGPDPSLIQALNPRAWRVDGCETPWASAPECQWVAGNTTASITNLLSDDYFSKTYSPQAKGMRPPWECWSCYEADVKSIVTSAGSQNVAPPFNQVEPTTSVYWDLQNEPGFGLGPHQAGTTSLYLQQFLNAYQTIKAIDGSIQVVLPSLSDFIDTPIEAGGLNDPHVLGFDSVIPYAVAHGMNIAALSWHANGGLFDDSPTVLPYEVSELKYLESEYGIPGPPKLFVNEYDPQFAHLLPGWSAGWIAALESAKVEQANRACWVEKAGITQQGQTYDECRNGSVDGLFTSTLDTSLRINGLADQPLQPQANYWVYRFYAAMTGDVLTSSTSDNTLTALATKNDASQTLDILLGRHKSCTRAVNVDCTTQNAPETGAIPTPPPAPVTIAVTYPYTATSVTASIADIPNRRGPVLQPIPEQQVLPVTNGTVTITLPAVADGDAYSISLTHS
jgi:hypothetical protein